MSRAVEVQPVFNRDVISELSDQANASLLDCSAWAEGEPTSYNKEPEIQQVEGPLRLEEAETDSDLIACLNRGDTKAVEALLSHFDSTAASVDRISRAFLTSIAHAPDAALEVVLATKLVDWRYRDEINDRNFLHKAALAGRRKYLRAALRNGVDPGVVDAHGRIPLHYAAMNGHTDLIDDLTSAMPHGIDVEDLDNFTPLIHAIVHSRLGAVERILTLTNTVDQLQESGHIPLNLACQYGSVEIVQLLLESRPEIVPDAEGLYPQHLVARFGTDCKLFRMLQRYGADLDEADKLYGWTPLFHAASEGRTESLKTLISCNVNIDAKDEKGQSALYYATWEGHLPCMSLLSEASNARSDKALQTTDTLLPIVPYASASSTASADAIPDLSLPPPIIPTRRYGHNFLENKATVLIFFGGENTNSVVFYDESKYPAARLTITPRSQDILPRNLFLPITEENKFISFETEDLDNFAIDFDVYPTFGKKVIAKASVPPEVFRSARTSSGRHYLSLLDPRLRAVGQMSFTFQVIKPFRGLPATGAPFPTYWKATSHLESKPSSYITDTSLDGDYFRLVIQSSRDLVPVAWPQWTLDHGSLTVPLHYLTCAAYQDLSSKGPPNQTYLRSLERVQNVQSLSQQKQNIYNAHISLADIFDHIPRKINLDIHILFPAALEDSSSQFGFTPNINDFVDSLLGIVFGHVEPTAAQSGLETRSLVFSSHNADLCTALNWKQPNCTSNFLILEHLC